MLCAILKTYQGECIFQILSLLCIYAISIPLNLIIINFKSCYQSLPIKANAPYFISINLNRKKQIKKKKFSFYFLRLLLCFFFNLFSTINLHTFFSSQYNCNLQFYEWKCLMYVVELWRLKITLVLQYQIDKLQFLTTSRPGLIYIQSICWNHFTFFVFHFRTNPSFFKAQFMCMFFIALMGTFYCSF